jgi:flagellar hook-length control protein FliK
VIVFTAAAIMSFIGAMVSLLRGKQFYWEEPAPGNGAAQAVPAAAQGTASSSAATSSAATSSAATSSAATSSAATNGHAPAANGNGANGNGAVPNGPPAGANGQGVNGRSGTARGPGEAGDTASPPSRGRRGWPRLTLCRAMSTAAAPAVPRSR